MTKRAILAKVVVAGQPPDWMPEKLLQSEPIRMPSFDEAIASISSETRALIIGVGVPVDSVTRMLPSVRTAFPTLAVVVTSNPKVRSNGLTAWADVVVADSHALERFFRRLEQEAASFRAISIPRKIASFAIPLAGLVALWGMAVAAFEPPAYLLPSPSRVLSAFLAQPGRLVLHLAVTAWEAALGFLAGNLLGIAFAIVLTKHFRLRAFTLPVLISLQAIPIVAFAPLLGVWLGTGLASKIAMAAIICFFPMVVNSLQAFATIERDFLDLFSLYRADFNVRLKRLLLPASAPAIIAALKISAGLSVVGAIVAEMTGADRGLGYLILNGAYRLETDLLFVAMVLSGLLGIAFFQLPKVIRALLPSTWVRGMQV